MIDISIVVAAYNVEKYINECIKSLLNQSCDNYEIIIVDDGSTDSTAKIIDSFSGNENIKIIHKKNEGVSVARNVGIENSEGKWLTFVDGDDFVDSNFIINVRKIINNIECDMIVFNYNGYFNDDNKFECRTLPFDKNQFITKYKDLFQKRMISQYYEGGDSRTIVSSGTTWCKVIKNDIVKSCNIRYKPGLIKAQDTVFWLNATEKVNEIYYFNKSLYNYRLSFSSISSGKKFIKESEKEFDKLIKEYRTFVKNKDYSFIEALNLRYIQVIMWNIDHNFFNINNNIKIRNRTNLLKDISYKKDYRKAINNANGKDLPIRIRLMLYFIKNNKFLEYYFVYKIYNFLSLIKNKRK
ncbi:glycosyltransferase family 2 protein [Anaerococcus hydrogenalis]|uniref:Glycosyltransferase, group 2 family protein n=1 Tax=Anaerococcus hydrogenalis ACS-025-V-Sch4 TaxID=879306 RepID=F0GYI7_9FIRM|nr:glycosyltransferase [Anaerococcus hydrogenalis]EGC84689.1 glycosyltransferase, group 2 family protein [Anaerococcus hydrogenalis ACS-025-V-Sch4]